MGLALKRDLQLCSISQRLPRPSAMPLSPSAPHSSPQSSEACA